MSQMSNARGRCAALPLRPALLWLAVVAALIAPASAGSPQGGAAVTGTWTTIIPDIFPADVFTWHLNADGTYREDGRNAVTGKPIQETLSGHWSIEGARLVLRQDNIPYVFDGVLVGDQYSGRLYLDGREVSLFCGAHGGEAPARCERGGVAAHAVPFKWASRP